MPAKPSKLLIARNVRKARELAEIGQAELARRIGLKSGTQMWRYESGESSIPKRRLSLIAIECKCSVGALLGHEELHGLLQPLLAPEPPVTREVLRIAQLGLAAAQEGTPDALERFNLAVLEHASRLRKRR